MGKATPIWLARGRAIAQHVAQWPRRLTLTTEGCYYLVIIVAVFAGGVVRDSNLMVLLGGLLCGPFLLNLVMVLWGTRRLTLARELPESVFASEPLAVGVACQNGRRRLASWALVVEDACEYLGPLERRRGAVARVLFPYVVPRQRVSAEYAGELPVRGRYHFGPLRLATRFPLGLFWRRKTFDDRAELIVWPRLGRLAPDGLRLLRRGELGSQRTDRRTTHRAADFFGLRDWRSGDSRRWIHWRSTARSGQIVVRQFDEARSEDLAIFLDLWQGADASPASSERVETAISFAATLVFDACRQGGRRLALHIAGAESFTLRGWASAALAQECLGALALVRPRKALSLPTDFVQALAEVRPPISALMVSTRPLDWGALRRPSADSGEAAPPPGFQYVDVNGPDLARYFDYDETREALVS